MAEPMVHREDYDEMGGRTVSCERCGMAWCEWREPVELLPGMWTEAGERDHTCPPPFPYETARMMVAQAATTRGGIVASQRTKARIRLGLEQPQ